MKMRTHTILALSAFVVSFAPTAAIAAEPNPYARADETWISIGGVVQDVRRTDSRSITAAR